MASFFSKLFGGAKQPPAEGQAAATGKGTDGIDRMDHASVVARARNHLVALTSAHEGMFQIGAAAWDVDLTAGTITFSPPNGLLVRAPVQVIGTMDTTNSSWMWGWDHPSVPEACAVDARRVHAYGEKRGIAELTTRIINCDEEKAWDFTALACLLAEAQGGYRGPAGPTLVFMTFGTLTMSKADKS